MSRRRSLVTPVIVAVLVSLATGVTFATAGSSSAPVSGGARATQEIPVTGLIVGRGLGSDAAADLSEAFPGWTIEAAPQRTATPVVVLAPRSGARRWRTYLLRYAGTLLPERATVVIQAQRGERAAELRRARRTAALLAGADAEGRPGRVGRRHAGRRNL